MVRELLQHVLTIPSLAEFLLHQQQPMAQASMQQFHRMLDRYFIEHEPFAYILGYTYFDGHKIQVNGDCLIPRYDTETLTSAVKACYHPALPLRIIDAGTGSGAIAIALAHHFPQAHIEAIDHCERALAIATKNVQAHGLSAQITCSQQDWLGNLLEKPVDCIVSNPPYIEASDPHLLCPSLQHEPQKALVAAEEGLSDIDKIIQQSQVIAKNNQLNYDKKTTLFIEHGYLQGKKVRDLMRQAGFTHVVTHDDQAGRPRVSQGSNL